MKKDVPPGTILARRFQVVRFIAHGGMGSVYEVTDSVSKRSLALKIMHDEYLSDAAAVERFRREGDIIRAIDNPSVVSVVDMGQLEDGSLYLALELLRGENLEQRLARYGAMIPELTLPLIRGICAGIGAAHGAGIVHRDLKPANVFLPDWSEVEISVRTGNTPLVKIVDFGIALVRGLSRLTQTGYSVGTTRSMAPEQLRGTAVDARADIYAIGLLAFEMLTGEHPFYRQRHDLIPSILQGNSTPLRSIRPALGAELEAVIKKSMSVRVDDRYLNTREFLAAYTQAIEAGHRHSVKSLGSMSSRITGPLEELAFTSPAAKPEPPQASNDVRGNAERRMIPSTRPPPGAEGGATTQPRSPTPDRDVPPQPVPAGKPAATSRLPWLLIGVVLATVGLLAIAALAVVAYYTLKT